MQKYLVPMHWLPGETKAATELIQELGGEYRGSSGADGLVYELPRTLTPVEREVLGVVPAYS